MINRIALTIDCEEWSYPMLRGINAKENGDTSFSKNGNVVLLDLFDKYNIKATFFVTGYFAEKEPGQVKYIVSKGHEIACHGYNHFYRGNKDLNIKEDIAKGKKILEKITGKDIIGFRAPQMQYSEKLIEILNDLNFKYDSSLHPCWIPGYYNNLTKPIKIFKPLKNSDVVEIPSSVSRFRMPISWMFIRLFGINRTIAVCKKILKREGVPIIYFHPWEFIEIQIKHMPLYYRFRTGKFFIKSVEKFIHAFKDISFTTLKDLIDTK